MRIIISALAMMVLYIVHPGGWLGFALWISVYLFTGYDVLWRALCGILSGQVFDENFLMAIATAGAIALALMGRGEYTEAIAVMLFYQLGELFSAVAVGKSRRSVAALMDIRPDMARVERDGAVCEVSPDEVAIGSVIVVAAGERIAIDGVIIEGTSSVDTSALTGESLPHSVGVGDEVHGGCINISGSLRIRTVKVFGDSTVSKILELVENASSRKSAPERFITKFARYYTPAVCVAALLLALVPSLVSMLIGIAPAWMEWLYRALMFLVISCPCALVVSIPLTFFSGIGGASREGILIKGSNCIEMLAGVDCIALDKTGTLTQGSFEVRELNALNGNALELLEYAALAESDSTHPIAKSLLRAYGKAIDSVRVGEISELRGMGIRAIVDGKSVAVGNEKLMLEYGITVDHVNDAATVVHVALDGSYLGYISISDELKENSAEAITHLRREGVREIVMLTGDREEVASEIAAKLGIDRYRSELLPDKKVFAIEDLIDEKNGKGRVAFAGDGINDAPVLSRADVGIAMGAIGSDAAIEAADVVIMDDDIVKLAKAVRISKRCMRIVKQNIIMTMGVKGACLLFGALGMTNMWFAIFADVGILVLAVLNSVRAMLVKKA